MRVEVEVPVIGWGQAKAGHSYKDIFASVPRVFEIPEYDVSEVPVVLAYAETHESGKARRSEYFGHGGKLYRDRMVDPDGAFAKSFHFQRYGVIPHPYFAAVSDRYEKRIHSLRKESDALAPKKMIPPEFGEHVIKRSGDVPIRIQTFQELGLKNFIEKAVEEQLDEFAKRMERMIVVGGNLMVEEQEPIVRIDGSVGSLTGRFGGYVHLRPETDRLVKPDSWSSTSALAFVSLAEIDTLESRVAAIEGRLGGHVEFEYGISDVEIDDARYLKVSGEGATLMVAADLLRRAFVQHMTPFEGDSDYRHTSVQKKVLSLEPAVFASVHGMITALQVANEFDIPEALEESMSSIMDMHARKDLSECFRSRKLLEYASDVLQLWQDREIGFDLGVRPALRA
ncbi:hypothetical protein OIU34_19830 [Pararhizobium sp. BT-229]|uniref:hypothetical protein n=1 Tax=Pararhizobium sp. BT-229 TaxID=2986923 RepID=UPI0021F7910C|nr:hypothetical protein [Pararhizobium sp. BT-229]MCV9964136.1 hypothetical protein [Pararhizobium sp. BT-229]